MEAYFPERVNTSQVVKHYTLIKKFALEQLKGVLGELSDTQKIEEELRERSKPERFDQARGVDARLQSSWEEMYSVLRLQSVEPKSLTVYEFFKQVEILTKKNSNNGKPN